MKNQSTIKRAIVRCKIWAG